MRRLFIVLFLTILLSSYLVYGQINFDNQCENFRERQINHSRVSVMSVHPKGDLIALGGHNGIDLYVLPTFEYLTSIPIQMHNEQEFIGINALSWSSDGNELASSIVYGVTDDSGEGVAKVRLDVWDTKSYEIVLMLDDIDNEPLGSGSISWSSNNDYIAAVLSRSGSLYIWNNPSGELIFKYSGSIDRELGNNYIIDWDKDDTIIYYINDEGTLMSGTLANIFAFEVKSKSEVINLGKLETPFIHIFSIDTSNNDQLLVSGIGGIQIWNMETLVLENEMLIPSYRNDVLKWYQDSRIVLGGGRYDGEFGIIVYYLTSQEEIKFTGQPFEVTQIDWFDSSEYVYSYGSISDMVTGDRFNLSVWDIKNKCLFMNVVSENP